MNINFLRSNAGVRKAVTWALVAALALGAAHSLTLANLARMRRRSLPVYAYQWGVTAGDLAAAVVAGVFLVHDALYLTASTHNCAGWAWLAFSFWPSYALAGLSLFGLLLQWHCCRDRLLAVRRPMDYRLRQLTHRPLRTILILYGVSMGLGVVLVFPEYRQDMAPPPLFPQDPLSTFKLSVCSAAVDFATFDYFAGPDGRLSRRDGPRIRHLDWDHINQCRSPFDHHR